MTREETFKALLAEAACVSGAGIALKERKSDRAVDVSKDALGACPERLELSAQLVGKSHACLDEILAGAHECLQRQGLVARGCKHGEAVVIGSGQLAQHKRIEAIALAGSRAEAITRRLDLVGVDREHREACAQKPSDQEPVGALDRAALHAMVAQQPDQSADPRLVMAEPLGSEQRSMLIGDVNVMPLARPVDPADCAHRSSSCIEVRLKNADQEVPWRVLIGRPSVGRRPVVALGASHRREALVSCGPSVRQARVALSRRWSAMCAEQSRRSPSLRSDEISLSRRERGSELAAQRVEVVL